MNREAIPVYSAEEPPDFTVRLQPRHIGFSDELCPGVDRGQCWSPPSQALFSAAEGTRRDSAVSFWSRKRAYFLDEHIARDPLCY